MRRLFIILLFTFYFALCTCFAQDYYYPKSNWRSPVTSSHFKDSLRPKQFFVSVNVGISFPQREFGSTDTAHLFMIPTNTDSTNAKGFANIGYHISVSGGFFLNPNLGVCAKISYSYNSFDVTTLNDIIGGAYSYSIDGSYNTWQFMAGGFARLELTSYTWFWLQGMVGNLRSTFPNWSVTNGTQTISGTLSDCSDLAWSGSATLEHTISENTGFTFSVTYTAAELSYPTSQYTFAGFTGVPPVTIHQNYPITMSYGSLDFSVGLLFHL